MTTEMQNHNKYMQNDQDETENNYLWMQNYCKETQNDRRVWLKTTMMTNNAYCFPFGVGDILRCTVKRARGCLHVCALQPIVSWWLTTTKPTEAIRDEDAETRTEQPEEGQMDAIDELAHIQAERLELFYNLFTQKKNI